MNAKDIKFARNLIKQFHDKYCGRHSSSLARPNPVVPSICHNLDRGHDQSDATYIRAVWRNCAVGEYTRELPGNPSPDRIRYKICIRIYIDWSKLVTGQEKLSTSETREFERHRYFNGETHELLWKRIS